MSRNMMAGRAKLTESERAQVDALSADGSREGQERAFRLQLRLARAEIRRTRAARRAKKGRG